MENQEPVFYFKTEKEIHGITIDLINNNPYEKIVIDTWLGELYSGSYEISHSFDIDNDHLGRSTAVFKSLFKPFKTSEMIKIKIKTKLYNDQVIMKLLTN